MSDDVFMYHLDLLFRIHAEIMENYTEILHREHGPSYVAGWQN